MAKKFIEKPFQKYQITAESVFYNIKQILLNQNDADAINLDPAMPVKFKGKQLLDLVKELETRYNMPVVSHAEIQKAKTLKELCAICANDFNKYTESSIQKELARVSSANVNKIVKNLNTKSAVSEQQTTNTVAEQTKLATKEYDYDEVADVLKKIISDRVSDYKGYFSPENIKDNTYLNTDLGLDSLDNIEIIIEFEKKFNVEVKNTSRLERDISFEDFSNILYRYINPNAPIKNLTIDDIYKKIEKYIYETHTISHVKPTSNWYSDLNLNNFQFDVFREWVEKEFNVKLSSFYFVNINEICNVIHFEIQRQKAKKTFHNRIQTIINKFKRVK